MATALARYGGSSATSSVPRLYDYVDPDALDDLFADRVDGTPRGWGTVTFDVEDATVTVGPDEIVIAEAAD